MTRKKIFEEQEVKG